MAMQLLEIIMAHAFRKRSQRKVGMSNTKHSSAMETPGEITRLLSDKNNIESLKNAIQFAHSELRRIAGALSRKAPGRTWQPTALLNEACIRLIESGSAFKNHRHFFGAASRAMRRVLVDEARKRGSTKRGGGWTRAEFREAELIGFEQPREVLDFDVALKRLEEVRADLAEIVDLRVFGELTTREIATILRMSESTARRRWAEAIRQLRALLKARAVI
jgi:RNA polymerase sigma factor (TIGR02999 family)